jgi:hypothetical protein
MKGESALKTWRRRKSESKEDFRNKKFCRLDKKAREINNWLLSSQSYKVHNLGKKEKMTFVLNHAKKIYPLQKRRKRKRKKNNPKTLKMVHLNKSNQNDFKTQTSPHHQAKQETCS